MTPEGAIASDGDEVLAGVEPPTEAELAAAKAMGELETKVAITAHLAEVDAWREQQP